jgi:aminopeptidase
VAEIPPPGNFFSCLDKPIGANRMVDRRIVNLAEILVDHSTAVRPGERVVIFGKQSAFPLMLEIYRIALERGALPYTLVRDPYGRPGLIDQDFIFYRYATDQQLAEVDPFLKLAVQTADVWIRIDSDDNTRRLSDIAPERIREQRTANAEITNIFRKRSQAKALRWVYTLFPTTAYAQDSEMSLREFEDFVYRTMFADQDDPVGAWHQVFESQQRLLEWLKGKQHVRVEGENVELDLSIEGRKFVNCAGEYNIPDGEIFTGPVEESVEGWVRFTYPAIMDGREVSGVELRFHEGRVEQATAQKNEEFLNSQLDIDPGARYLGEFAVGTNTMVDRFTRNILFDEKIGGTIHMALGSGYTESGSKNESLIHWDMICDMKVDGRILVDGELFYEKGEFMLLQ